MKTAAALTFLIVNTLSTAAASQYGCTVLLCLAGDWNSIAECRPPIRRLFHDLSRGRPFPSCAMQDGNDSGSNFTRQGQDPIADCPADMVETAGLQYDYGGPYRTCRSRTPSCSIQVGHDGPREVCQYTQLTHRQQREKPHWIDVYVDGRVHTRVWW